ncbi:MULTISPECIES: hypothetical protein [Catenuloplanes]|uniref:Uncharacterized protein n=1 Tax=Catenuloplanes niger TaxID=587534 RepID=A0AAE4CTG5_9ACTN|nr:hypothetical protein [Catenuloplanes niger]MDR7323397.1 hypothetical protein [Catenuloplanes niger]
MTNDANSILMGSAGAPSAKFPVVGTMLHGTVVEEPTTQQQTNFRTKAKEFWPDGQPKMQVLVVLQTSERDPEVQDDDGKRTLFIKGKELTNAIRDAVRTAGAKGIHRGGTLTVQYVGDGQPAPGLDDGPKLYAARYEPPSQFAGVAASGGFIQPPSQQAAPQQFVQPAAVPPASPVPPQFVQPAAVPAPAPVQQYAAPAVPQQPVAAAPAAQPAPPGVDPAMWASLNEQQRAAVLALSAPIAGAASQQTQPPY